MPFPTYPAKSPDLLIALPGICLQGWPSDISLAPEYGDSLTAAHGHFAFFGAFALLVMASVYYIVPRLQGVIKLKETRGIWAFSLMSVGMIGMVLSLTFAGIIQVYLNRMLGMDFIQVRGQYANFWLVARWIFGLGVFFPGTVLFVWDFLKIGDKAKVKPEDDFGKT